MHVLRAPVARALVAVIASFMLGGALHAKPKVVIIGFDGADARLVERWMDEGHLPNLSALRAEGTYAPLQPTNPPQTPVSWSAFATGKDPGKTEIFDFLKRDPANYIPDFALMTPGKRVFGLGARNGAAAGAAIGAVAFLAAVLLSLFVRTRWSIRLVAAAIVSVAVAVPSARALGEVLPVEVPSATNNRKGDTFWGLADRAGLKVQVIRVPATFPAEPLEHGTMLSGLGVPDMRERVGTPAYYTSDPTFRPGDNEFSLELVKLPARRGRIQTRIIGPRNLPFYEYVVDRRTAGIPDPGERAQEARRVRGQLDDAGVQRRIDLPMTLDVSDTTLTLQVSGQERTLRVGEWSDWVTLDFPVNWLVDRAQPLRGAIRFKLLGLDPEIQLYHSPIMFHPDCHPIAFAWPPDFSERVAERFGMYKTIGWALDTWSPTSGIGGDDLLLEDADFTVSKYEEIMEGLLSDGDADLYVQIFYFPDRIGHLFWRHVDAGHPLHDPALAAKYAPELLKAYERMDRIVGRARELAGDDAAFLVLSDHGFSSFRRGVNLNTWLVRNGYMTLKGQGETATLEDLFDTGDLFQNVDWSRTKAYALGLGSLYVNLVGRERDGIVMPGTEYREVVEGIRAGLEALVDPETGERPVSRVWTRDEMYSEFDPDVIPDLRVGNALDYRVSWQTTLGGVPADVVEDNTKPWSGDHCSNDPDLVRGILFSNRPIATATPAMVDIMPTVLRLLDLPVPDDVDGKPLL